jgi:Dolichyl-phosphate-mannose-protein mannosyltransferase
VDIGDMTTGQEVVPEGTTAAVTEPDQPAGRSRRPAFPGRDWSAWWPLAGLAAVLVVQLILSLRLARANTAFQDEALYLWAGHREWAHILHGAPLPPFPVYFSGAPVLYPPIGALADSIGGLAAARILSTLFMLGATTLLWSATGRLFGRRAAFFAAALFAISGPALHLGSFATYDGLSVLLVALSAWCVVRAGDRRDATLLMAAAGLALAVANAAAYSTMLMDPVIIAMAWLTALPRPGGKPAATRPAVLFIVTAALLLAGVLIGGGDYLTGFTHTTLNRVSATDAPWSVLAHAWSWTGVILILAACGILVSAVRNRLDHCTWLLAVLTAAAVAGPVEQASLHTMASLNKHVGVGAWFAAIAAGYAADQFIASAPARWSTLTTGACVVALAFPAAVGATQSWQFSTDWPSAASFTSIFGGLVRGTTGRLLVEDPSIAEYYLPAGQQWQRWSSTRNIVLPSGASTGGPTSSAGVTGGGDPKAFATYIARGYWSMIALNFADTTGLDHAIAADIKANKHYRIAQVIPYGSGTYVIYRYEPGS